MQEVPRAGEDLTGVLVPCRDRERRGVGGEVSIEELERAITAGGEDLGFVGFGKGEIEEGILCVEPGCGC